MTELTGKSLVSKAREAARVKLKPLRSDPAPDRPQVDRGPVPGGARAITCWQRDIQRHTRRLSEIARSCAWVHAEVFSKPPALLRPESLYGNCLLELFDTAPARAESETSGYERRVSRGTRTADTATAPAARPPEPLGDAQPKVEHAKPSLDERDASRQELRDLPRQASPDLLDRYRPRYMPELAFRALSHPGAPAEPAAHPKKSPGKPGHRSDRANSSAVEAVPSRRKLRHPLPQNDTGSPTDHRQQHITADKQPHTSSPYPYYDRELMLNWQRRMTARAQERLLFRINTLGTGQEQTRWMSLARDFARDIATGAALDAIWGRATSDGIRVSNQFLYQRAYAAAPQQGLDSASESHKRRASNTPAEHATPSHARPAHDTAPEHVTPSHSHGPQSESQSQAGQSETLWGDEPRIPEVSPLSPIPPMKPPTLESLLAQRGTEIKGVPPDMRNVRADGRSADAEDTSNEDLHILSTKIKRILEEEARRFGIDV